MSVKSNKINKLTTVPGVPNSDLFTQKTSITLKKALAEIRPSITAADRPVYLKTLISALAEKSPGFLKSAPSIEWACDLIARRWVLE